MEAQNLVANSRANIMKEKDTLVQLSGVKNIGTNIWKI